MGEGELIAFLLSVVALSLSGVLMPGPVTAVTVAHGAKNPHAGAWVAIGHGVIEFPLMALIFFGVGALFERPPVKSVLGLAGGLVLWWMGWGMIRDFRPAAPNSAAAAEKKHSPFWSGIILSAANPYFLIWWATAGAALISRSWSLGAVGFFLLAITHWSCDLVWYYFLSALSFRGGRFFGRRLQEAVFIVCGLALLHFSGYFLGSALFGISR